MNENQGSLEYEVERLKELQRKAHAALDYYNVPRNKEGGEDWDLPARMTHFIKAGVSNREKINIKLIMLEGYLEDQGDELKIELKVEWLREMIKELKGL